MWPEAHGAFPGIGPVGALGGVGCFCCFRRGAPRCLGKCKGLVRIGLVGGNYLAHSSQDFGKCELDELVPGEPGT